MSIKLTVALLLPAGFLVWSGMDAIRTKKAYVRWGRPYGMIIKGRQAVRWGYLWLLGGIGILLFILVRALKS